MVLIILGLAALGGGVTAWALFRNTEQTQASGSGAPDEDVKVGADAVLGEGVSTQSPAEGFDSVARRADEGDDKPARSAAAAKTTVSERYTADVFLDDDIGTPVAEWSTRIVDKSEPDTMSMLWIRDDIVIPRDAAGGPISPNLGLLAQEQAK
jgi:hypothetical protein